MTKLNIAEYRRWIGRTEVAQDSVTPRMVSALNATLDGSAELPKPGALAPQTFHWCLAPPIAAQAKLGSDGHPARGSFLPPVPLPRRMWAGSKLKFHGALRVGDIVERHSMITDVVLKEGRSGALCFVTVAHEFFVDGGLVISEQHDIVYRDQPDGRNQPAGIPARQERMASTWRREMRADPVMLFRYSALTFNGHRIHYDRTYAIEIEGYPGLVVHGPLQATFLAEFAVSILGRSLQSFAFRGLQPLFDFVPFTLCATEADGGLHLWIVTDSGVQTMDAWAE